MLFHEVAMGNNRNKQKCVGVFRAGPSNRAKVTEHQRVYHVWRKTTIELSTIIENVEKCVLDRDIKKSTWVVVQISLQT